MATPPLCAYAPCYNSATLCCAECARPFCSTACAAYEWAGDTQTHQLACGVGPTALARRMIGRLPLPNLPKGPRPSRVLNNNYGRSFEEWRKQKRTKENERNMLTVLSAYIPSGDHDRLAVIKAYNRALGWSSNPLGQKEFQAIKDAYVKMYTEFVGSMQSWLELQDTIYNMIKNYRALPEKDRRDEAKMQAMLHKIQDLTIASPFTNPAIQGATQALENARKPIDDTPPPPATLQVNKAMFAMGKLHKAYANLYDPSGLDDSKRKVASTKSAWERGV